MEEEPKADVLTIEHLKALKDLRLGLHPAFDMELFKANNPNVEVSYFLHQHR